MNQPDIILDIKNYEMHWHFTDGGSVLMFGEGIKKGNVYSKTADERPSKTIKKSIMIEQIHQTIYLALGVAGIHSI